MGRHSQGTGTSCATKGTGGTGPQVQKGGGLGGGGRLPSPEGLPPPGGGGYWVPPPKKISIQSGHVTIKWRQSRGERS